MNNSSILLPLRIAKIVNDGANETITYYHQDHLLSTRLLTNENGNVIEEEEYEEFGSDINHINEKYKYTGKEKDITGLYYYGARYYDPTIGRFTTKDPARGDIMNPQSLNPYVYCMNNPLKYIDPDGESPWDHDWLPDGALAPDEKRLEEYMREIESGDHNFDEETVGRIREWSHKAYEERTRFWSKEHDFPINSVGFEASLNYVLGVGSGYGIGFVIDENWDFKAYLISQQGAGFSVGGDATFFVSTESAESIANSLDNTGIETSAWYLSFQVFGEKKYAGHNKYHFGGSYSRIPIGGVYWKYVVTEDIW